MRSSKDIRSLDETFYGVAASMNQLIEWYPPEKGFFSVDQHEGNRVSELVATLAGLPNGELRFTIDIAKECWVVVGGGQFTSAWPIDQSPTLVVWIFSKLAESFEEGVERMWGMYIDTGREVTAFAVFTILARLNLMLKFLCDMSSGEFDEEFVPFSSEIRSDAKILLPLHAEKYWEFDSRGIQDLIQKHARSDMPMKNFGYICDLLEENGFPPGYKFDLVKGMRSAAQADVDRFFKNFKR